MVINEVLDNFPKEQDSQNITWTSKAKDVDVQVFGVMWWKKHD